MLAFARSWVRRDIDFGEGHVSVVSPDDSRSSALPTSNTITPMKGSQGTRKDRTHLRTPAPNCVRRNLLSPLDFRNSLQRRQFLWHSLARREITPPTRGVVFLDLVTGHVFRFQLDARHEGGRGLHSRMHLSERDRDSRLEIRVGYNIHLSYLLGVCRQCFFQRVTHLE